MARYLGEKTLMHCEIAFPKTTNFSGNNSRFANNGGKRYFDVRIDDPAIVADLEASGVEVKSYISKYADEDAEPMRHIKVLIGYHDDPKMKDLDPIVWRVNTNTKSRVLLDADSIGSLDRMSAENHIKDITCSFTIREYDPNPLRPEGGTTLYLKKMVVWYEPDPIDAMLDALSGDPDIVDEDLPF